MVLGNLPMACGYCVALGDPLGAPEDVQVQRGAKFPRKQGFLTGTHCPARWRCSTYPLVMTKSLPWKIHSKWRFFMGKSSINGSFSMAMLNSQRINQIRGEIATVRINLDIFEEPSSAHLPSLNPQYANMEQNMHCISHMTG